jgi:hypothetical protein
MLYSVKIDPAGIGGNAPQDGFIDPTTVEYHRSRLTYTGTVVNPVLVAGSQILVRDVPVVVTGVNLAQIILDINSKSYYHHVSASADDNKLQLTMLPGFENLIPTLVDFSGESVAALGFSNPTVSQPQALPTTLAIAEAKERGNVRWELILQNLQLTGNIGFRVTNIAGASVTDAPSSVEFILEVDENYYNYDLTGAKIFGKLAIEQTIAKALMFSVRKLRDLYDPTDMIPAAQRPLGQVVRNIEVGPLTLDEQDAIDAVTVTPFQIVA